MSRADTSEATEIRQAGAVVAANVMRVLGEKGLTRYKLSRAMTPAIYTKLRKGQLPNVLTLLRIAAAIDSDINTLVAGVNADYDALIGRQTSSREIPGLGGLDSDKNISDDRDLLRQTPKVVSASKRATTGESADAPSESPARSVKQTKGVPTEDDATRVLAAAERARRKLTRAQPQKAEAAPPTERRPSAIHRKHSR